MNEFLYEGDVIGKLPYLLSFKCFWYTSFSLFSAFLFCLLRLLFRRESNLSDLRVVSFFLLKHGNSSSNGAIVVNPMTSTLTPSAPPLAIIEQQQTVPIVIATPAPFESHDTSTHSSYYHQPDIERPSAPLLGSDGKSDSLSNVAGKKG
jgi:hypothetical protein